MYFNLDDADEFLPLFEIEKLRLTEKFFEIDASDNDACNTDADLCMKVTYSDGSDDYVTAKVSVRSEYVLKGRLASDGKKVVIVLADEDNPEDTVNKIVT